MAAHENRVGEGTCTSCHAAGVTPAGEHVLPFNYSLAASAVRNACNADGTENRFGATGLDNDGDGLRDDATAFAFLYRVVYLDELLLRVHRLQPRPGPCFIIHNIVMFTYAGVCGRSQQRR